VVDRVCLVCGKHFSVKPHVIRDGNGKYCSKECAALDRLERIKCQCIVCGKRFYRIPSQVGDYCSNECFAASRREDITLTCEWCGREYSTKRHYVEEGRRFCSRECWRNAIQGNPKKRELSQRIGSRMRHSLYWGKNGHHWEELVGYTLDDLMDHLESQFKRGMTWDNYGDWHIDHIRPIADFDYEFVHDEEFKQCWSLWNLQPLWAKENRVKGVSCEAPPLPM